MDPLTAATTFAQLVGLLTDYVSSKGSRDTLDAQDLARWAATHGHVEVMQAIERNQATAVGVKAALAEGRDELLAKLNTLDEKLSAVAAGLGPLDAIAKALRPESVLSVQALEILCEFEVTGAPLAIEHTSMDVGGPELLFQSQREGSLEIREERFYHDDMASLVNLGLLSASLNSRRDRVFRLTRLGSQVAQQVLRSRGER